MYVHNVLCNTVTSSTNARSAPLIEILLIESKNMKGKKCFVLGNGAIRAIPVLSDNKYLLNLDLWFMCTELL